MNLKFQIIVIKILDRVKESVRFQKILSENSKIIKTRLGLHELNDCKCSREGLIILELNSSEEDCKNFLDKLNNIEGIIVKTMIF